MKFSKFSWSDKMDGAYFAYYNDGKTELGFIDYYKPWKRWVWNQGVNIIMSESCIKEVLTKLTILTEKIREKKE